MEPLLCEWTAEGTLKPLQRHEKACDATFVVGERYFVTAEAPRNMGAHRAYFAELNAIWRTLPEGMAEQYPSSEHLRKWALCRTGYCTESQQIFTTPRDAVMAAAFAAAASEYSIVEVVGRVVRTWKPESQRVNAMGAQRFKESKAAVLNFLAAEIGVTREQAQAAAERDAA